MLKWEGTLGFKGGRGACGMWGREGALQRDICEVEVIRETMPGPSHFQVFGPQLRCEL